MSCLLFPWQQNKFPLLFFPSPIKKERPNFFPRLIINFFFLFPIIFYLFEYMNLNPEHLSVISDKHETMQSPTEFKSLEVHLSPQLFTNEDSSPTSARQITQMNDSLLVKLCLRFKNSESFLPLTNTDKDSYEKTKRCHKVFVLIAIIGVMVVINALTYISDLKENAQMFFNLFLLGTTLITVSLTLAKGCQALFIFIVKNNIWSIAFAYFFNWVFLFFFAFRARSCFFSLTIAVSQVN